MPAVMIADVGTFIKAKPAKIHAKYSKADECITYPSFTIIYVKKEGIAWVKGQYKGWKIPVIFEK